MEKTDDVTVGGHRRTCWEFQPGELLLCCTHPWGAVRDEWVLKLTVEVEDCVCLTFESTEGLTLEQHVPPGTVFVCAEDEP